MLPLSLRGISTVDAGDNATLFFTLRWGVTALYLSQNLRHNEPQQHDLPQLLSTRLWLKE